jgi:hypothetical protein
VNPKGCIAVWEFDREEKVGPQTVVPWDDAQYEWKQYFKELARFKNVFSEDFAGTSRYSTKTGLSAGRIVGAMVKLTPDERSLYVPSLIKEKSGEIQPNVIERLRYFVSAPQLSAPEADEVETVERLSSEDVVGRPINYRGIIYAPLNEAGVILLFSRMMPDLGIIYESSPTRFPDMIGRRQVPKGFQKVRIEFEYMSNNFFLHKHDPRGCDLIVCWENNLSADKVEQLEQNGVEILALSDYFPQIQDKAVFEQPFGYQSKAT